MSSQEARELAEKIFGPDVRAVMIIMQPMRGPGATAEVDAEVYRVAISALVDDLLAKKNREIDPQ